MLLVMTKDRNRPDRISCRDQGYLFVLGRRAAKPVNIDGRPQEFMITGALGTHPKGLIVEPVTTEYKLVAHRGFECAGSMCSTTAWTGDKTIGWLTPGRVQDLLPIAENVNVGWNGHTAQPLTPGHVFVKTGERRAAGLPDLTEIDITRWAALIRHRKMLAEHRQSEPPLERRLEAWGEFPRHSAGEDAREGKTVIHIRTDYNESISDAVYMCGITTAELRAAGDKSYHRDETISAIEADCPYCNPNPLKPGTPISRLSWRSYGFV